MENVEVEKNTNEIKKEILEESINEDIKQNITIARANAMDIVQFAYILVPEFNKEFSNDIDDVYKYNSEDFHISMLEGILHSGYVVLIAKIDKMVVGGIAFQLMRHPFNKSLIYASELFWYVKKEFRKLQVGTKLLKEAELIAKSLQVNYFHMAYMPKGNLKEFYESQGYKSLDSFMYKKL